MDKLINKVGKDLSKGKKDLKVLLKADKNFDKKIDHAKKVEKSMKKKGC